MTIPPNLTLCANVTLFALMIWRRVKAPYLWAFMLPTMVASAFYQWNEHLFQNGNLPWYSFNTRLDYMQHVEHSAEAVAVIWLARRFSRVSDAELFVLTFAVMHLLVRLDDWLSWFPRVPIAFYLEGDIFNLLLIAAMAWAVCSSQRNRALEEVWQ